MDALAGFLRVDPAGDFAELGRQTGVSIRREGWSLTSTSIPSSYNFYTSILRGDNFSYDELTEIRKDMAARVNGQELMEIWNQGGKYYPDSFQEAPVDGLPLQSAANSVLTSV